MNQFTVSLWGDEGFSAVLSMKPIPEIIKIIARDTSPPLYNITEHIWFGIFGSSEIAIRSLSFLYFLVAIFFTYKIGALLWNKKTGAIAATLTFLNPFFFSYAFEGRMYSILAASVVASMYFFLKRNWVGYVIATTAALYSHHFSVFAVAVQGLWFIKEFATGNKQLAIKMLKAFMAVGILYLPWVVPLYKQIKMVGGGFWLGTPTLDDIRNLIYDYLAEGIRNKDLQLPTLNTPFYHSSLYLVFALLIFRKWWKNIKKTLFLISWFLLPVLLTWLISQKFQSIFFNRYLLYTIPAAMLVVASQGRGKISAVLIGLTIVFFSIIDYHYFTHPTKLPFREMAAYVKQSKNEADSLINWNSASHHLWETKYYDIPAPIFVPEGKELPFYVGTALMGSSDIIHKIPEGVGRVGIVTSGPIDEVSLPGYTEMEAKTFANLKFIWYTKNE